MLCCNGSAPLSKKVGKVMKDFEIEITRRYRVTADSEEHALASYRVVFDDIPANLVGLNKEQVIDFDDFEFLEETGRAVWAGE
jgi:hypothetical protein